MNATFEDLRPVSANARIPTSAANGLDYGGPERRRDLTPASRWLALMLEEVGHGMLLLSDGGRVLHANHLARAELDPEHPLCWHEGRLRARYPRDESRLHEALHAAGRGLRRMLVVGEGERRVSAAVVPLDTIDGQALTLVSLGKRQLSHQLTLACFARSNGLTGAETRVLERLCAGVDPIRIAALHGVEISTVRTQITCIRHKTGAADITSLVMLVAQLPPMVPVLRAAFAGRTVANDGARLSA